MILNGKLSLSEFKYNVIVCLNIVKNIAYNGMMSLVTKIFIQIA